MSDFPFRNKPMVLSACMLACWNVTDLKLRGSRPEHDQNFMPEWLNINYLNAHFCPESDVTLVRSLGGEEPSILTFVFQTFSHIDPAFLSSSLSLHATLPHRKVFIVSLVPKPCGVVMGPDSRLTTPGRRLTLMVNIRCLRQRGGVAVGGGCPVDDSECTMGSLLKHLSCAWHCTKTPWLFLQVLEK